MKKLLLSTLLCVSLFGLEVGKKAPELLISDENGAKVSGEAFDTNSMAGKLSLVFYVDPDEKETNSHVSKAIKAHQFDRSEFQSYAIINMDATWLPNFAIASSLEEKQAEFPDTVYVKDLKKNFVYMWEIADDSSNIVLIDKAGKVLFVHEGKMPEDKLKELIALIDTHS